MCSGFASPQGVSPWLLLPLALLHNPLNPLAKLRIAPVACSEHRVVHVQRHVACIGRCDTPCTLQREDAPEPELQLLLADRLVEVKPKTSDS